MYPPLEASLEQGPRGSPQRRITDRPALLDASVRPMDLRGMCPMNEIEHLARTGRPPNADAATSKLTTPHLEPRFFRRWFASLLERAPPLTYNAALAQSGSPPRTRSSSTAGSPTRSA